MLLLCADHKGEEVRILRGLVVLWSPLLWDDYWPGQLKLITMVIMHYPKWVHFQGPCNLLDGPLVACLNNEVERQGKENKSTTSRKLLVALCWTHTYVFGRFFVARGLVKSVALETEYMCELSGVLSLCCSLHSVERMRTSCLTPSATIRSPSLATSTRPPSASSTRYL